MFISIWQQIYVHYKACLREGIMQVFQNKNSIYSLMLLLLAFSPYAKRLKSSEERDLRYRFTFGLCIGKRKSLKFIGGIIQRAHLNTHQTPEYICIHNESEM